MDQVERALTVQMGSREEKQCNKGGWIGEQRDQIPAGYGQGSLDGGAKGAIPAGYRPSIRALRVQMGSREEKQFNKGGWIGEQRDQSLLGMARGA